MRQIARLLAASAALPFTFGLAGAQVGYDPARSPFRDLVYRHELTFYTGHYQAGKDPAGAAPQGGPMVGVRYEVRLGGPVELAVRTARVFSQRAVVDPTQPAATRMLGTGAWPLWLSDVGVTLNLTGQKSFYHVVPVVHGALGIASDFRSKPDIGGFKFGTTFALAYGAGLRWVPGGRWQMRADVGDHLYQLTYPNSYFVPASDGTTVLRSPQGQNVWKHNLALTLGASYLFFR